mmetsp:Transcript_74751/g.216011  ORF Transcript_74751/g.216011 Transcript_74751/m.216011 type:complete len:206 (+) Transcript_74751:53-670(+)
MYSMLMVALAPAMAAAAASIAPRAAARAALIRVEGSGEASKLALARCGVLCARKCAACMKQEGVTERTYKAEVIDKGYSTALFEEKCPQACASLVDTVDMHFRALQGEVEERSKGGLVSLGMSDWAGAAKLKWRTVLCKGLCLKRCAQCLVETGGFSATDVRQWRTQGHHSVEEITRTCSKKRQCSKFSRFLEDPFLLVQEYAFP